MRTTNGTPGVGTHRRDPRGIRFVTVTGGGGGGGEGGLGTAVFGKPRASEGCDWV